MASALILKQKLMHWYLSPWWRTPQIPAEKQYDAICRKVSPELRGLLSQENDELMHKIAETYRLGSTVKIQIEDLINDETTYILYS